MKQMVRTLLWVCLVLPQVTGAESAFELPNNGTERLPPGVPRVVSPDGSPLFIEPMFTTGEFQTEALRLIIAEANKVAEELQLPEPLPITTTNLTHRFISGFGFMLLSKAVGNVTTSNYQYCVARDYKFSRLCMAHLDARCIEYLHKYQWPVSRLDTNAAYRLAIEWMEAIHIDIEALNRDCVAHAAPDPSWNLVAPGGLPKETFTPIYCVWWVPKGGKTEDSPAELELFLPTKTILQLDVSKPKYILREPLVFTNLAALFPGQATIKTNWPVKPQYIRGRGP